MGRLPVGAIATVALLLAGSSPVLATTEPCTPATFQPELLQNPSFETGNIAPWVAHKLCTGCDDSTLAEIVKGDAKDGAWVFRDTIRDNTARAINQTITVDKPGQPHNVSWWYRYDTLEGSLAETCAIRATIDYSNPLGQIGVFSTVLNTGWNLASLSWTPKGSAGAHTFFLTYGCNFTTVYLDDIQVLGPVEERVCSTAASPSSTPSRTVTPSGSSTPSSSFTPSGTLTTSGSSTPSRTPSSSFTPSGTLTTSGSSTASRTPSSSFTPSGTSTTSGSPTPSRTPSSSFTPSGTSTTSGSSTPSGTLTSSGPSSISSTLASSGSSSPSTTSYPISTASSRSTRRSCSTSTSHPSTRTFLHWTSSSTTITTATTTTSPPIQTVYETTTVTITDCPSPLPVLGIIY